MKSVLITGCNRGIGLGLVQQLVTIKPSPNHIITTCRNIEKATALKELQKRYSYLHILEIDVNNLDAYPRFLSDVRNIVKEDGLNLLINNAGVSSKFTRIGLVKAEQMLDNFKTNTLAPVMLTKTLLPLLKTASEKNSSLPLGIVRAAVVNISSILGSINDNSFGGFYPYRCSKAALNAATKSLSVDLKDYNILVVSVHPGWCKTDLGGANAPLTVEHVVREMWKTLHLIKEESNGQFIQYDGKLLPW